MNTVRRIGWVLLALAAVCLNGCTAGSVAELGVFGSHLDSDDLGAGYGAGVKLEIKATDWLSVDGRASWVHFDDFDVDMLPLEVALRLNFPLLGERIVPYAGVGGGHYSFEADDIDLADNVGYFPLVGLEVGTRRVALFVEARWLFLDTDVDTALENIPEADVDGLGINAGLLFRF
jgi:hypothetical protein